MTSDAIAASHTRDVVPLREATRVWVGISLRTFGGPAGQIAVMHRELVDERRWFGEQRFLHALSFCTLLPGPEAQQLAIYLGWLLNGTAGGLVAGALFVLPGYVALLTLSIVYVAWGTSTAVTAIFAGLAPAVLAIVAQAVLRIARRALRGSLSIGLAIGAFIALFALGVPFPLVVAAAGLAGFLGDRRWPVSPPPESAVDVEPPLIPDDALHGERPTVRRAALLIAVGGVLWALPIVVAVVLLGRSHVFVDEGVFFSGTAVVTFGGAYAVLSFVAQRAVETYHWLLPGEMVNGLALAETTPGPLIMVVQYVGFLGAYRQPGNLDPWLAGVLGSTLVVWVTFVPCFLFVLVGAPHIERVRQNSRLAAALRGVTAAVVGVIANLSVYFAVHTLFERQRQVRWGPVDLTLPRWTSVDWLAVSVALIAVALAFGTKLGVLRILGICAAVGATLHLITT